VWAVAVPMVSSTRDFMDNGGPCGVEGRMGCVISGQFRARQGAVQASRSGIIPP
jgi:hypothetical protein